MCLVKLLQQGVSLAFVNKFLCLTFFKGRVLLAEGVLTKSGIRRVLLSSLGLTRSQQRTQAVRHLIDAFLETFPDRGIDYAELVHDLNWIRNPCRPICPGVVKVDAECWERATPARSRVEIIQYRTFMEELKQKL